MEFRELNRQLAKVKSSFLARKQNDFTVKGDNFTIEVAYEKTGYFYSSYMLNVKYNNYVYFQMCKDPYKVWEEMQNSIKVVEMITPTYFVMENVPNLLTAEKGFFKQELEKLFTELGYTINAQVLCAADYGVPQLRERNIFLIVMMQEQKSH